MEEDISTSKLKVSNHISWNRHQKHPSHSCGYHAMPPPSSEHVFSNSLFLLPWCCQGPVLSIRSNHRWEYISVNAWIQIYKDILRWEVYISDIDRFVKQLKFINIESAIVQYIQIILIERNTVKARSQMLYVVHCEYIFHFFL